MKSGYHQNLDLMKDRLNRTSPSLCLAKWTQSSLHLNRGLTHSCHLPPPHEISLEQLNSSPSRLHNTEEKMAARKQMLQGDFPGECGACWTAERLNEAGHSPRILKSGDEWSKPYLEDILSDPLNEKAPPRYLEVSFSGKCNLKCSYCSPQYSSSWSEEVLATGAYKTRKTEHAPHLLRDSYEESQNPYIKAFWSWWPDLRNHLHTLHINGGEPLLSENTFRLLEEISLNPLPRMELFVSTNLNAPRDQTERFLKKISSLADEGKVKGVQIFASLDAMGEKAEYIRYGLNEAEFWKNLENVLRLGDSVSVTIMAAYNLLSVSTFQELLERVLLLRKASMSASGAARLKIDVSALQHPSFLAANLLPDGFITQIEGQFSFMKAHRSSSENLEHGFYDFEVIKMEGLLDWARRAVTPTERKRRMLDFHEFIREHDLRRGTEFLKVFPEYESFFRDCAAVNAPAGFFEKKFPHFSDIFLREKRRFLGLVAAWATLAILLIFASRSNFSKPLAALFLMGFVLFGTKRLGVIRRSLTSGIFLKLDEIIKNAFQNEIPESVVALEANQKLRELCLALRFLQITFIVFPAVAIFFLYVFAKIFSDGSPNGAYLIWFAAMMPVLAALFYVPYRRYQKRMNSFQDFFQGLLQKIEQRPKEDVLSTIEQEHPGTLCYDGPPMSFEFLDHAHEGARLFKKCNFTFTSGGCVGVYARNQEIFQGLYDLLSRRIDPLGGKIAVFGVDIKCLSRKKLFSVFKILSGGELLVPGGLKENLDISHPEVPAEKKREALSVVNGSSAPPFPGWKFILDLREDPLRPFKLKLARALLDEGAQILYFRNPFAGKEDHLRREMAEILERAARFKKLILVETDGGFEIGGLARYLNFPGTDNPSLIIQRNSAYLSGRGSWLFDFFPLHKVDYIRTIIISLKRFFEESVPRDLCNREIRILVENVDRVYGSVTFLFSLVTISFLLWAFLLSAAFFPLNIGSLNEYSGWIFGLLSFLFLLALGRYAVCSRAAIRAQSGLFARIQGLQDWALIESGREQIARLYAVTSKAGPMSVHDRPMVFGERERFPEWKESGASGPPFQFFEISHAVDGRRLFHRFSLTFVLHELVSISYESDALNAEFLKLLRRETDPQAGAMKIFGKDMREFDREDFRRAVVFCDFTEVLYSDNAEKHLGYHYPKFNRERIRESLRFVGIQRGERPEMQGFRLKIARLYLDSDSQILYFRNVFSGKNEGEVSEIICLLRRLAKEKQLVLLECESAMAARQADKILFLRNGANPLYSNFSSLLERQESFKGWVQKEVHR